jgi:hypothetical protein
MEKDGKITESTLLPLSIMGALLSIGIGGAWWMSALYSRVALAETNIQNLQANQKEIVQELKSINYNLIRIETLLTPKDVQDGK